MADMTELKNIVRKGIVQSVDKKKMKAQIGRASCRERVCAYV